MGATEKTFLVGGDIFSLLYYAFCFSQSRLISFTPFQILTPSNITQLSLDQEEDRRKKKEEYFFKGGAPLQRLLGSHTPPLRPEAPVKDLS